MPLKNKKQMRKYQRKWYSDNLERNLAIKQRYRDKNKDWINYLQMLQRRKNGIQPRLSSMGVKLAKAANINVNTLYHGVRLINKYIEVKLVIPDGSDNKLNELS